MTAKKRKKMLKYRRLMLKHKLIRLSLGEMVLFRANPNRWFGVFGTIG